MISTNQQASASQNTSHNDSVETKGAIESRFRSPHLTDVMHMWHIAEEILPTLTLKQASLLAGSSKEMCQIINSAFAQTLPDIQKALNNASPEVRNIFKPIKLGSPGNLDNIRARINAGNSDLHPALRAYAHRIGRANPEGQNGAAPSPLRRMQQHQH